TVTTWSEYLKSLGLEDQNEYTEKGTNLLKTSPKLNSILSEILRSSRARFMRKGIQLDDETLKEIGLAYYSMYVGEGIALQNQPNTIIVNFEEMRVAQLEQLGAQGKLTITTPIKPDEMEEFYKWKNEQIRLRNKGNRS